MAKDPAIKVAIVGGVFTLAAGLIAGVFALAGHQTSSPLTNSGSIAPNPAPVVPRSDPVISPTIPVTPATTSLPTPPVAPVVSDPPAVSGTIPASLIGSWSGAMQEYDPVISYYAGLVINATPDNSGRIGNSASVVGDLTCSGSLKLYQAAGDSVILLDTTVDDPTFLCDKQVYIYISGIQANSIQAKITRTLGGPTVAEALPNLARG
jgi:hypothetical protein